MLKAPVRDALNAQLNMEFAAFYTYLSMSAYFESEGLTGFAAWMDHHSQEEMAHAMRIYRYLLDRRQPVELRALEGPRVAWDSALAAVEDAMAHEQAVTASINALSDLAVREGDHATRSFLDWFVTEQVEEEQVVDALLSDLRRVGDFAPGLFMLDRELAAKTPGRPTEAAAAT
jgi:ferritin